VTDFQPIESQAQLDAIISKRVRDEKALSEEVDNLKAQLEARDKELRTLARTHAVEWELARRGISDEARMNHIRASVDLESETEPTEQIAALATAVPMLFQVPKGAGSGGSSKPVLEPQETPLTEEDISKMDPQEMTRPGVMERVDRFMRGERG
jgi:hypothetical protein